MGFAKFVGDVVWSLQARDAIPEPSTGGAGGGEGLLILPLSQDRTGIEDVKRFYEDLDLDYLALYLDDTAESQFQFSVTGLPVTMLVNPNGRVVGRMLGAVEWDAPEALALFRYFLAEPQR